MIPYSLLIFLSIPLSLVTAFFPSMLRAIRGHGKDSFGSDVREKFVASTYIAMMYYTSQQLFIQMNEWLKMAGLFIFRANAVTALYDSFHSKAFGLSFVVTLDNPESLEVFMQVRREIFRHIVEDMDLLSNSKKMLGFLVGLALLVAVVMFIHSLEGQPFSTFNITGSYLLVVLSVYTVSILYVNAYIGHLLNDEMIKALSHLKFKISKRYGETVSAWRKKKSATTDLRFKSYPVDIIAEMASMEMMVESAMQRIANPDDEGLYIRMFGIPVTFALLFGIASSMVTAIGSTIVSVVNI